MPEGWGLLLATSGDYDLAIDRERRESGADQRFHDDSGDAKPRRDRWPPYPATVRMLAVGVQPVGVIAIGANATGVLAIGELATGVIAIGQLARGGVAIGQLALGIVSVGQLAVGVAWATGQLGIAATSGAGIVFGPLGRLYALPLFGRRGDRRWIPHPRAGAPWLAVAAVVLVLAALWWFAAGATLLHELTRTGGILVEAPPPLR